MATKQTASLILAAYTDRAKVNKILILNLRQLMASHHVWINRHVTGIADLFFKNMSLYPKAPCIILVMSPKVNNNNALVLNTPLLNAQNCFTFSCISLLIQHSMVASCNCSHSCLVADWQKRTSFLVLFQYNLILGLWLAIQTQPYCQYRVPVQYQRVNKDNRKPCKKRH